MTAAIASQRFVMLAHYIPPTTTGRPGTTSTLAGSRVRSRREPSFRVLARGMDKDASIDPYEGELATDADLDPKPEEHEPTDQKDED